MIQWNSPRLHFLFACFISSWASGGLASLYLNGTDISSAFNQTLKGVDVHIDERGNIFITAPHYYVNEAEAFVPLSGNKPTTPPHVPLMRMQHEKLGDPAQSPDAKAASDVLPNILAPALNHTPPKALKESDVQNTGNQGTNPTPASTPSPSPQTSSSTSPSASPTANPSPNTPETPTTASPAPQMVIPPNTTSAAPVSSPAPSANSGIEIQKDAAKVPTPEAK